MNNGIHSQLILKEYECFLIFSTIILKDAKVLYTGYHSELKDDIPFCTGYKIIIHESAQNYIF